MSSLFFVLVFAAIVAAIVIRRKVNEPHSPLGTWLSKNLQPRMALAARVVAYLTLAAWFLIFAFTPKEDGGTVGELMQSFRTAIGLEKTKSSDVPSIPPPFRIPGPEETAKPNSGR